jgi:thiaminase
MSEESVVQVEGDLGFAPKDAEVLKGVRLIWQKLQKLRQQALKDERYVKQYKDLLAKGIAQARAQQPAEAEDDIVQEARLFWDWYVGECQRLGIAAMEENRGSSHQAWCEKWLSGKYAAFAGAIDRTVEQPTQQHYDEAKAKASAMLKAYVEAFKGR